MGRRFCLNVPQKEQDDDAFQDVILKFSQEMFYFKMLYGFTVQAVK